MHPIVRASLAYTRLGYSVLPLAPGEKRPQPRLAPRGLKDATPDPEAAVRWVREVPKVGLGLLPPPGVLVLDIDDAALVKEVLERFGLHDAPRQKTPKGGAHVFLRIPPGLGLTATTQAMPGLDVRGLGRAYVAAYPTALPAGRYLWVRPLTRPEELPQAPKDLLDLLLPPPPPPPRPTWAGGQASPRRLQALLGSYAQAVATAPKGTRHLTLVRYARAAGGLIPHGLAREEALETLVEAAMRAGLPEAEARAAAAWGLKAGEALPLDLGDFGPRGPFWANTLAPNKTPSQTAFSSFGAKSHDVWTTLGWGEEVVDPWA